MDCYLVKIMQKDGATQIGSMLQQSTLQNWLALERIAKMVEA
jgi:hypothetical protein